MSTGAMTGADAPALRALAAQMSQSAGRLDAIRQGIRSRLYSVHWDGPDGATFRRMWDGQHVPLLAAVAEGLRGTAEQLLAEADQQEAASGAGTGGGAALGSFAGQTIGPSTGRVNSPEPDDPWADWLDSALDGVNLLVGGAGAFVGGIVKNYSDLVPEHLRNGITVQEYRRWAAGHASDLNRLLGSASGVARLGTVLDGAGKVVPGLSGALAGYEQYQEDRNGGYGEGERTARAVGGGIAAGGADYLMDWGAVSAGAAIGTMIAPGIGTFVGGMVGWGVSAFVNLQWGDQISDFASDVGADLVSGAIDIGEAAVDFGGDVLEAGGDLLEDAGDLAGDVWDFFS